MGRGRRKKGRPKWDKIVQQILEEKTNNRETKESKQT